MTTPASSLIRAARVAARGMADRTTPFIFNEWYVAALADELGRSLLKRKILGRNIVMFRTLTGTPVALDDRCAHRSYPLSAGTLDGDTLVCGYHGLRYDEQGDCIEVPSQGKCPKGIGVRNYPLVERGPLVWIWMGASPAPPPARPPDQPWLESENWTRSQGYFHLPASYVSLHENLMDLTHLSFLHARTFGTPDYATAPYDTAIDEGHFMLTRRVAPTRLPPVWAKPTGIEGNEAARITTSEFITPGLHLVTANFSDLSIAAERRKSFQIKTAHIPTPESRTSTHYFIVHGRDFALEDPGVTRYMHDQLFLAFEEDVRGLTALEQVLADAGEDVYEMSIASDKAAVAMRKYLKQRADGEGSGDLRSDRQAHEHELRNRPDDHCEQTPERPAG